ncbi:hypothetical protein BJX62DRAFT_243825 [Aspergillus germanicus]
MSIFEAPLTPETGPFGYIISDSSPDIPCPGPKCRVGGGSTLGAPRVSPVSTYHEGGMDTSHDLFPCGVGNDCHFEPLVRANATRTHPWSYPCAGSERQGHIWAAHLATDTDWINNPPRANNSWKHVDRQSMISQTSTEASLHTNQDSKADPLNWGSDTSFQPNNSYTIPAHHPSEKDTINRLLESTKWLILHYKDMSGKQPATSRHIIRGRPRGSLNKLPRKRVLRTDCLKKAAHIRSEQVRRDGVNRGFEEFKAVVPGLADQNLSKSGTLHVVCDWIEEFSRVNEGLRAQLGELERNT